MEYLDEKILEIKNKRRREQQELQGQVNIGGTLYEITTFTFFNGKIRIKLPKEFTDMPPAFAKLKYPAEQRPQIIKMNEDGSINLTLSLYPEKLKEADVFECISGLKTVIERVNPANLFFELKVAESPEVTVGYFEFKSNAIDSDLYNIMFVTPIEGQTLLGTFNCRFSDREDWKPVALQLIMSIRDLTKPTNQ